VRAGEDEAVSSPTAPDDELEKLSFVDLAVSEVVRERHPVLGT
jgi:hypothetical protein